MIKFYKYQGSGNDFILIQDFDSTLRSDSEFAKKWCNRHFGIGADGILYIQKKDQYYMKLMNSDGSEGAMCGNGIRCVAKHLYDFGFVNQKEFEIDTASGVKRVQLFLDSEGKVSSVKVDMGKPEFLGTNEIEGEHLSIVSMGNPHAILFKSAKPEISEVKEKGPRIEKDKSFPNRTNVEFAHIKNENEIDLVVYERGAGLTLACGTGACATVAAAAKQGLIKNDGPIKVHLPGGDLIITLDSDYSKVFMEGPAKLVFEGNLL